MPILNWIGKEFIVNHEKEIPFRLLKKIKSNSVGVSENLIIEGDNLEALKALLPYYQNAIKCIYIDPPYNTGNEEWTYNDSVNAPKIKQWLGKIVGEEDLTRHDKWLCMMYPRLKLLRELLSEDGVIFISIGENEVHNLRNIMDEIFGEENFLAKLVWNTEGSTDNQLEIKVVHEYILLYLKDISFKKRAIGRIMAPDVRTDSKLHKDFIENTAVKNSKANPPSEIVLPRGFPCELESLKIEPTRVKKEFFSDVKRLGYISRELTSQYKVEYPIRLDVAVAQRGKLRNQCRVFSGWANANKLKRFIQNNCMPIDDEGSSLSYYLSNNGVVIYKRKRISAGQILSVIREVGTTTQSRSELERMGIQFEYPKPVGLVKYLIETGSRDDSVILDSFAGSGTTADAVLRLNKERKGGSRKFILVELESKICRRVTSTRVRKTINGYVYKKRKIDGVGGGFQYCELDKPLFDKDGMIERTCTFEDLASYIYFTETKIILDKKSIRKNLIGTNNNVNYYLIFTQADTNVLDNEFLDTLAIEGHKVIYADKCTIDESVLQTYHITFKQIPYEVRLF